MKHKLFIPILFFGVGASAAKNTISFDEALQRILERSTDIHIQETNVDAADYNVLGKKGAFLPNLSANGQRGTTAGTSSTSAGYFTPTQNAGLASTINIFHWGSDLNQLTGAQEDLHNQRNSLENTRLATEDLAVGALTNQIQSRLSVEVLQRDAVAYENYFNIAKLRFNRGLLAIEEVDKVNVDLDNAQARLKDAQTQVVLAEASVSRLLGSDVDVRDEWPWKERLQNPKIKKLLDFSPSLEERPDIRAAIAAVNAEAARLRANRGTLYPSLSLTFNQGFSENEDGSNQQSTTGLTLSMDIFDGLSSYSQYKVQYNTYAAADLRLRQLRLDAETGLVAARQGFAIALETAVARDRSFGISQKLYNTGELRFKQGRANANDLEIDHRRLIDSALLNFNGWSAVHQRFTKLCHAYGRAVEKCEFL